MIDSRSFHMIEQLTRADVERHPVWSHYEESCDRSRVLSWGVSAAALDAEMERFQYCGTRTLYPVLEYDPLPDIDHLIVAAEFVTAAGTTLLGYLIAPDVFGVFVGEREFCFNRSLVGAAAITARKLSEALGEPPEALFPLRYSSGLRSGDGRAIEGEIQQYW